MNQGIKTIIFPVKDLAAAKAFYGQLLGVEPHTENAYYVGFRVGDQEIGLDPNGHRNGTGGPIAFSHVSDIRQSLEHLVGRGGTIQQDVKNVGRGKLVASVKDADGNVVGLLQPGEG
jgi:predicted enzyme related to lactoylglutathione lyase